MEDIINIGLKILMNMKKLSAELEQKVIELIKANKVIEAVTLIQNELNLGLKNSKDIVDKYRQK